MSVTRRTLFSRGFIAFIQLLCLLASRCLVAETLDIDKFRPPLPLNYPLIDLPYNHSDGFRMPSMGQSLAATKSFYQYAHYNIGSTELTPFQQRLSVIGFDVVATFLPLGTAWQHEEWHRAVMGQYGIDSYNEVYEFQFFVETIAVSRVKDEDLIWLKRNHPADMVRLHSAGIEADYELALALEKDQFFYDSPTWDVATLWLNYSNSIGYIRVCASNKSNEITSRLLDSEDQNIAARDFTGLDCNAWVYDLYRPDEPYANRGTHPSGVGINRYIDYSRLSNVERNYLRRQASLSLLNLFDPFLLGIRRFSLNGEKQRWHWNASLRHHLTPFGYNIGINVFYMKDGVNLFTTFNYFAVKNRHYFGLDGTLLNLPISHSRSHASLRAAVWQQPENLLFYDEEGRLGGLLSATANHKVSDNWELFAQLSAKSQGWVPGEVALNREASVKLGLSYLLYSNK